MIDATEAAQALGKLGAGKRKTMTRAAMLQRKRASKRPRPNARKLPEPSACGTGN